MFTFLPTLPDIQLFFSSTAEYRQQSVQKSGEIIGHGAERSPLPASSPSRSINASDSQNEITTLGRATFGRQWTLFTKERPGGMQLIGSASLRSRAVERC